MEPAKNRERRDRRGTTLNLGATIGQGGEAIIYEVTGRPDTVAKIYRATPADYAVKLTWMIGHPPVTSGSHPDMAWPSDLVFDTAGTLEGFLMPRIRGGVPLLTVFNPRKREQVIPNFDRRCRYRAARNLAAAVQAAHDAGYVIGDLNESNALVTATALVVLLDTDSFQVRVPQGSTTRLFRSPVGKPEYTAPELQGLSFSEIDRTFAHDRFALGVLLFQLLMEGNHPYRHLWQGSGDPPGLEESVRNGWFPYAAAPKIVAPPPGSPLLGSLDPALSALMKRCFVEGHRRPGRRPTAGDWHQALMTAETTLRACGNGHYHAGHLKTCPDCAALARLTTPPPTKKLRRQKKAKPSPAVEITAPPPFPGNVTKLPPVSKATHQTPAGVARPKKRVGLVRLMFILLLAVWLWNNVVSELGSSPGGSAGNATATATAPAWEPPLAPEFPATNPDGNEFPAQFGVTDEAFATSRFDSGSAVQ
jgi:DNA-binding helix-hairpin-helix protein with protein kinase domain